MEQSIETIWKEGFLNNDALIAPKLNNLYNRKSKHLVDKYKRMYRFNINALMVFSILLIPFSFATNMPYMGIPMSIMIMTMAVLARRLKKRLDDINYLQNSYEYLSSFDGWVKDMLAINRKLSRFVYPFVLVSMTAGFWFSEIGGDILGQKIVSKLLVKYPDMIMISGVPLIGLAAFIAAFVLLFIFGPRIGQYDMNLVYGRILRKLDEMMKEMNELRRG